MFTAFDGLKKEGFTLTANFQVSGNGGFHIGEQLARNRHQVSLASEGGEFILGW